MADSSYGSSGAPEPPEEERGAKASDGVGPKVYEAIADSGRFVDGLKAVGGGRTRNTVKNKKLRDGLRKVEGGHWSKVYREGYVAAGNKVSVHCLESASGRVFDVKTVSEWGNL